jgi:hypothetical protein
MTAMTLPDLATVFPALMATAIPQEKRAATENKVFKDDVAGDLVKRKVWYNDQEMGGYHFINGVRILCIFDRYDAAVASVDSGNKRNISSTTTSGIQTDMYVLYIRSDEYNGEPRIGQEIKVDGRKFYVADYIEYDGQYDITMKVASVR